MTLQALVKYHATIVMQRGGAAGVESERFARRLPLGFSLAAIGRQPACNLMPKSGRTEKVLA